MIWIILYLASTLLVPTFYCAWWCGQEGCEFKIDGGESAFQACIFCVFWPMFVCITGLMAITKTRAKYYNDRSEKIIRRMNRVTGTDRSDMVTMSEDDLKFLLKGYRLKRVSLDSKMVEWIREELMNRNAERSLLR